MIRVFVPENLAMSFLTFINQNAQKKPEIKTDSRIQNEKYFTELNTLACSFFDDAVKSGFAISTAVSETNYSLKSAGFANVSYNITRSILQKNGRLKQKIQ